MKSSRLFRVAEAANQLDVNDFVIMMQSELTSDLLSIFVVRLIGNIVDDAIFNERGITVHIQVVGFG